MKEFKLHDQSRQRPGPDREINPDEPPALRKESTPGDKSSYRQELRRNQSETPLERLKNFIAPDPDRTSRRNFAPDSAPQHRPPPSRTTEAVHTQQIALQQLTPPTAPPVKIAAAPATAVIAPSPAAGPAPSTVVSPALQQFERRVSAQHSVHRSVCELYQAMRGGAAGIGTDEPRLFKALERRTPEQVKLITEGYKDRFGRDLVRDIMNELKQEPRFVDRVKPLLTGDIARGEAAGMKLELDLPTKNAPEIIRRLLARSPEELQQLSKTFEEIYKIPLKDALAAKLTGNDLARATAILDQKLERFEALQIRELILDRRATFGDISERLLALEPAKLAAVREEYQKIFDTALEKDLPAKFGANAEPRIELLMQGDKIGLAALDLRASIKDPAAFTAKLYEVVQTLEPRELPLLKERYLKEYGIELPKEAARVLEGQQVEAKIAERILRAGEISPAEEIVLKLKAAANLPKETVKSEIVAELAPLDAPKVEVLKNEIKTRYGLDLESELKKIFAKPDHFDVRTHLLGKPESLEDELALINAKYRFERPSPHPAIERLIDRAAESGKVLEKNMQKLNTSYQNSSRMGQSLEEADELELLNLLDGAEDDIKNFRGRRHALSRAVSNIIGVIGAALGILLGRELGEPGLVCAAMGAASGLICKFASQSCLRQRFGEDETLIDELKRQRGAKRPAKASRRMRTARRPRRSRLGPMPKRHTFIWS